MKRKVFLSVAITVVLTCSVCVALIRWRIFFNQYHSAVPKSSVEARQWEDSQDDFVLKKLLEISSHIAKAHRYARSAKVITELNGAHQKVVHLLQQIYQFRTDDILTNNSLISPRRFESEVCPEVWLPEGQRNGEFDFPFYFKGYETVKCGLRPVEDLVTLLLDFTSKNAAGINNILHRIGIGLSGSYSTLKVIVAVRSTEAHLLDSHSYNLSWLKMRSKISEGEIWRRLASKATSKYVIVGRDLIHFDNMTSLDRLVRTISTVRTPIVGGSFRDPQGLWHSSCYQIALKNYTLRIVEGYDITYNSCLYCEYSDGPFMTKTTSVLEHFDRKLSGFPLFLDFFLRLRGRTLPPLVCPDVMFYRGDNSLITNSSKADWLATATAQKLNKVVLPNNSVIQFNCNEVNINCAEHYSMPGIAMPICCTEDLSNGLQFLISQLNHNQIRYEVLAGTTVGSLKLNGILPWERDGDVYFHVKDYGKLLQLIPIFNASGYHLKAYPDDYRNNITCLEHMSKPCGYFSLKLQYWEVSLWGLLQLSTDLWNSSKWLPPTQVRIGSVWAKTFPNPSQATRNLYGDDIFEHLEHTSHLGGDKENVYQTGTWNRCKQRKFHGCLTNFLPTGNIQFFDTWV